MRERPAGPHGGDAEADLRQQMRGRTLDGIAHQRIATIRKQVTVAGSTSSSFRCQLASEANKGESGRFPSFDVVRENHVDSETTAVPSSAARSMSGTTGAENAGLIPAAWPGDARQAVQSNSLLIDTPTGSGTVSGVVGPIGKLPAGLRRGALPA